MHAMGKRKRQKGEERKQKKGRGKEKRVERGEEDKIEREKQRTQIKLSKNDLPRQPNALLTSSHSFTFFTYKSKQILLLIQNK